MGAHRLGSLAVHITVRDFCLGVDEEDGHPVIFQHYVHTPGFTDINMGDTHRDLIKKKERKQTIAPNLELSLSSDDVIFLS